MRKAIRYLIVKKLAGDWREVKAVMDVIVNDLSPSEAAYRHGVSKERVINSLRYMKEIIRPAREFPKDIFSEVYRMLRYVPTVIDKVNGCLIHCHLCRKDIVIYNNVGHITHIYTRHRGEVERYMDMIMKKINKH